MATPTLRDALSHPHVFGEPPGPRSTEQRGVLAHGLNVPTPQFSALVPRLAAGCRSVSAADERGWLSCQ